MPMGAHALAGMAVTRTPTHRTIICRMASFKWPSEVGFEPLLSLAKEPALLTEGAVPESSNGAVSKMPSLRGTEGSNPVPSTGESPANRDRADQRKQRRSRSTNLCAEIHNRMSVILGPEQRRSAAVIDVPFAAIAGTRPISAGTIPMSPVLGVIWACGDHARQSSPAGIARPEHRG
jgi:hypothetical protein